MRKKIIIAGITCCVIITIAGSIYAYSLYQESERRAYEMHCELSVDSQLPKSYTDLHYYLSGNPVIGAIAAQFRETKEFKENWSDYQTSVFLCEMNNKPIESTSLYKDIKAYVRRQIYKDNNE